MPKADEALHFDSYREQTEVKHDILEAYLAPYFSILNKDHASLLYIDGFAGEGIYEANGTKHYGSPLRALKLIAETPKLSSKVDTYFIENRNDAFPVLKAAVDSFYTMHPDIRRPMLHHGRFEEGIHKLLIEKRTQLPPTFLFVDPCGVSGASFQAIKGVMSSRSCEAFIFFNITGVKRVVGTKQIGPTLLELMGSKDRAEKMFAIRESGSSSRERVILDCYLDALREDMEMKFTIPFRIEYEDKKLTSHYLIHATKNQLGFAIMKDVMWMRGRSPEGQGSLEFTQASHTGVKYLTLFEEIANDEQQILSALESGPKLVSYFTKDWVYRPADLGCRSSYRKALLDLEGAGRIEVTKDGRLTPASVRPKRNGQLTIAEHYSVRLPTRDSQRLGV